jgi:hypothetical protein
MGRTLKYDARTLHDRYGNVATPNPMQRWALFEAMKNGVDEFFAFGGFGSGKTQWLAWLMSTGIKLAYQAWNGKRSGRAKFALISHRGAQLRTVTFPALTACLNAAVDHDGSFWDLRARRRNPIVLGYDRDDHLYDCRWFQLVLGTGHDGCSSLEGHDFLGIGADESPLYLPEALDRIRARYRQVGFPFRFLGYAATPQAGRALPDIRVRYQGCDPGKVYYEEDEYTGAQVGRMRVMMPTFLNLPNLPPGYIQQLKSGCSPQMAAAILKGELVTLEGRVYPTYDAGSVIPYEVDLERPVTLGYDPGFHRPYAMAIQEIEEGSDRWVAFDEIAMADVTRDTFGDAILRKPWSRSVMTVVQDPAAEAAQTSGESDRKHLQRMWREKQGRSPKFVHARHSEDRIISYGCERGRAWLMDADGNRRFYVRDKLERTSYGTGSDGYPIAGIHLTLSEQAIRKGTDEPDRKGAEDHKSHPGDAFRYLAVKLNTVRHVDPTEFTRALSPRRSSAPPAPSVDF